MPSYLEFLLSAQTLAIALPALVFIITVYLIIKRVATVMITIILLLFAILSGLAVMNYDVVREYAKGGVSTEEVDHIKTSLDQFREDVLEAMQRLQEDIRDIEKDQESVKGMIDRTQMLLYRLEDKERTYQVFFGTPQQESDPNQHSDKSES